MGHKYVYYNTKKEIPVTCIMHTDNGNARAADKTDRPHRRLHAATEFHTNLINHRRRRFFTQRLNKIRT